MQMVFSLNSRKISVFLSFIILGFALANFLQLALKYGLQYSSFFGIGLFNLDAEAAIPTWFASMQLLLCGVLLALIAQIKRVERDRYRWHWIFLSGLFVGFSVDEAVGLHERLDKLLRPALNTQGLLYFAWVIPAGIFVLVMLLLYSKFFWHLLPKTRYLFLIAGGTYVLGAVGMEMLGAPLWQAAGNQDSLIRDLIMVVEETLELIGAQIFLYALLTYIGTSFHSVKFLVNAPSNLTGKAISIEEQRGKP